jgi:hypothetical protein
MKRQAVMAGRFASSCYASTPAISNFLVLRCCQLAVHCPRAKREAQQPAAPAGQAR